MGKGMALTVSTWQEGVVVQSSLSEGKLQVGNREGTIHLALRSLLCTVSFMRGQLTFSDSFLIGTM